MEQGAVSEDAVPKLNLPSLGFEGKIHIHMLPFSADFAGASPWIRLPMSALPESACFANPGKSSGLWMTAEKFVGCKGP